VGSQAAGFARVLAGDSTVIAHGIDVALTLDATRYAHPAGAYLFAAVLERFLGLYAAVNAFLQAHRAARWTSRDHAPMASPDGREDPPLIEALRESPQHFEFFQAVLLLEQYAMRQEASDRVRRRVAGRRGPWPPRTMQCAS